MNFEEKFVNCIYKIVNEELLLVQKTIIQDNILPFPYQPSASNLIYKGKGCVYNQFLWDSLEKLFTA